jgi:hypothetical protein
MTMPRGPKTTWRPRSSSVGYYIGCHYRAAIDRAVADDIAPPEFTAARDEKETTPSPYADLGTCIHFVMQDGLGCEFPGPSIEYAPEPAQWANAATLCAHPFNFDNDVERVKAHAHKVASIAAAYLPKASDGRPWLAETAWSSPLASGHIDFLSQNHEDLWDLKTTSKPPMGHIKAAHLYQMLTYRILTKRKVKRGGILYVSSAGEWAVAAPIDFSTPAMEEMTDQTEQFLKYARSAGFMNNVFPQIGPGCADNFCPYAKVCRDRFLPTLANGVKSHAKPLAASASPASSIFP